MSQKLKCVASEKTASEKAFYHIFEPVGENFRNKAKLKPKISLEKNKKRIKLSHEKVPKSD